MSFNLFRIPRVIPRTCLSSSRSATSSARVVNVVSDDLCDQLVRRLAPTFEKDVPYDIVDINPAGPLLSSRIHDLLKPRVHVLIEPNTRQYEQNLKHLVEQPGSTFKYRPGSYLNEHMWHDLFNEEGLLQRPDRRSDHVNKNLVILYNVALAGRRLNPNKNFLTQYLKPGGEGSWMHRYGRPRLIALFRVDDTGSILPRTFPTRRRLAAIAEATSNVVQLAGSSPPQTNWDSKGMRAIKESDGRAALRQKAAGVETPRSRTPNPLPLAPLPAYPYRNDPGELVRVAKPRKPWHDTFIKLEADVTIGKLQQDEGALKKAAQLRRLLLSENRLFKIIQDRDKQQEMLDKLHEKLRIYKRRGNYSTKQVKSIVDGIDRLTKKLDEQFAQMSSQPRSLAQSQAEHRRALKYNVKGRSILQWDQRPYEPFRVYESEFSPKTECAFLDIQPSPLSPAMRAYRDAQKTGKMEEYLETADVFYRLCQMLGIYASHPLPRVLQLLFPGRSVVDLVEAIPSLCQLARVSISFVTQKWGEKKAVPKYSEDCLSHVTYRTVSASVLWDMSAEWYRWPFKPVATADLHQLLGGHDGGDIEFQEY